VIVVSTLLLRYPCVGIAGKVRHMTKKMNLGALSEQEWYDRVYREAQDCSNIMLGEFLDDCRGQNKRGIASQAVLDVLHERALKQVD
jgi:predicted nucleotidyltransferase